MLIGILIYIIAYMALLLFDWVTVFQRSKKNESIIVYNYLRYIRALELVMGIFLIPILELVVCHAGNVSMGFVKNTSIILGAVAIIYCCDFTLNEWRLRDYSLVLSALPKKAFGKDSVKDLVKFNLEDMYINKNCLEYVSEEVENIENNPSAFKGFLISRMVLISVLVIAVVATILVFMMNK